MNKLSSHFFPMRINLKSYRFEQTMLIKISKSKYSDALLRRHFFSLSKPNYQATCIAAPTSYPIITFFLRFFLDDPNSWSEHIARAKCRDDAFTHSPAADANSNRLQFATAVASPIKRSLSNADLPSDGANGCNVDFRYWPWLETN